MCHGEICDILINEISGMRTGNDCKLGAQQVSFTAAIPQCHLSAGSVRRSQLGRTRVQMFVLQHHIDPM